MSYAQLELFSSLLGIGHSLEKKKKKKKGTRNVNHTAIRFRERHLLWKLGFKPLQSTLNCFFLVICGNTQCLTTEIKKRRGDVFLWKRQRPNLFREAFLRIIHCRNMVLRHGCMNLKARKHHSGSREASSQQSIPKCECVLVSEATGQAFSF